MCVSYCFSFSYHLGPTPLQLEGSGARLSTAAPRAAFSGTSHLASSTSLAFASLGLCSHYSTSLWAPRRQALHFHSRLVFSESGTKQALSKLSPIVAGTTEICRGWFAMEFKCNRGGNMPSEELFSQKIPLSPMGLLPLVLLPQATNLVLKGKGGGTCA